MIRVLIAGIVAGLVFFFWGFLSHMVIGLHSRTIHVLPNEDAVREVMRAEVPHSGAYVFPMPEHWEGMTEEERTASMEDWSRRHEAGPIGLLFIQKEGVAPMQPIIFAGGMIIFVLTGLVASTLLCFACPSLPGYFGRWLFVVGIGVTAIIFSDLSMWNWWPVPTDYTAMLVVDHLVGWGLAGFAIAALVKAKPKPGA
jgi:hypothetical protein